MIKFAGNYLPQYVKVSKIEYSILPNISHKSINIAGRPGAYDYGTDFGQRKITLSVQIIGNDEFDILKKARVFATYLFHKELQELIILDEPDKFYMARVTGDTDLSELYRIGQGNIEFVCPSPFAESLEDTYVAKSPTDLTPITVTNSGSTEVYPIINLTLRQDSPSVAVISDDKFIQLGLGETTDKKMEPVSPTVLSDNFSSFTGWSTGTNVDGGIITGTFASNGFSVSQAGKDYGTGTQWHGAAAIKSLSRQVQDFSVQTMFGLNGTSAKQIGRVEVYLLDVNNTVLGKIAFKDGHAGGDYPYAEARAGSLTGGKYYAATYGDYKGVWRNLQNGYMRISRKGKNWSAYFCDIDSKTGRQHTRLYKEFYDYKGLYQNKLAKIQIHIGTHSTYEPVNSMYLSSIKVTEHSTNMDSSIYVPKTFLAGDIVTIDNDKALVLRNGEPIFTELDPSSDFISLNTGVNGLVISPPVADVEILFREKWL